MATIQIRNVPENVHRVYRTRAARAGMSLQQYLLAELIQNAEFLTPAELMDQIEQDTWYVALAEWLGTELLTADEHLANTPGVRCAIRVP